MRKSKSLILLVLLLFPILVTNGVSAYHVQPNNTTYSGESSQGLLPGIYSSEPAPMGITDYGVGPNGFTLMTLPNS